MKCPKCGGTKIIKEEVSNIMNFIFGFAIYLLFVGIFVGINLSFLPLAFAVGLVYYLCGFPFKETRYKCIDCGYTWS